jgi:hypothetical protein
MGKNELIESLLNSDIQENRELGSLLLCSEEIPEEEREGYINDIIEKFLYGNNVTIDAEVFRNAIKANKNLSKNKK